MAMVQARPGKVVDLDRFDRELGWIETEMAFKKPVSEPDTQLSKLPNEHLGEVNNKRGPK